MENYVSHQAEDCKLSVTFTEETCKAAGANPDVIKGQQYGIAIVFASLSFHWTENGGESHEGWEVY